MKRKIATNDWKVTITRTTVLIRDVHNAISKAEAKQKALQELALDGWIRVNDEALVMEVERVYETRYDCRTVPEGVRQAA